MFVSHGDGQSCPEWMILSIRDEDNNSHVLTKEFHHLVRVLKLVRQDFGQQERTQCSWWRVHRLNTGYPLHSWMWAPPVYSRGSPLHSRPCHLSVSYIMMSPHDWLMHLFVAPKIRKINLAAKKVGFSLRDIHVLCENTFSKTTDVNFEEEKNLIVFKSKNSLN